MFQFTTTNVINSSKDSTGKPLWSLQEATDERSASFNVKRVGNFSADYITHIYKAVAVEAKNAIATIDLSLLDAKEGDKFRLNMYIRLTEGSNFSLYANDSYYKGKPFVVDFVWKKSNVDTAKNIKKMVDKFMLNIHGEKMIDVTVEGSSVIITGVNGYQRFAKVDVEKLDEKAYHGLGEYTVVLSTENEGEVELEQGVEGFGTYEWILHNLRLPTPMRTVFNAINENENPIPGELYDQYTIHYCVNRGTLGSNAVGDQVTSHTTHVFYVRHGLNADFEAALMEVAPETGIEEIKATEKTGTEP